MHEILEALRREHATILRLLDALEWQVSAFERGQASDYDVIGATLEYFLGYPDAYHHPKEDLVFAKLGERDAAAAAGIGDLLGEHREIGERAREFATGLHAVLKEEGPPKRSFVQRARRFIEMQRQHLFKEEAGFFPAADKALRAEDWAELEARMKAGEDPLFGEKAAAKFERLRQMILTWQAEDEAGDAGVEPRLSFNENE